MKNPVRFLKLMVIAIRAINGIRKVGGEERFKFFESSRSPANRNNHKRNSGSDRTGDCCIGRCRTDTGSYHTRTQTGNDFVGTDTGAGQASSD